jgi:hypothetical protein
LIERLGVRRQYHDNRAVKADAEISRDSIERSTRQRFQRSDQVAIRILRSKQKQAVSAIRRF